MRPAWLRWNPRSVKAHLRRLVQADATAVLDAFLSNPDMNRQGDVHDRDSAERYVARLLAAESNHRSWVIARPDDDLLAGLVAVTVEHTNRIGWFWYWLNAADRGRGWARAAAATVADWALDDEGLHRLELGHRANNPASGQVALAAGFTLEGRERAKFLVEGQWIDVLTYGRLDTDPVPAGSRLELRA